MAHPARGGSLLRAARGDAELERYVDPDEPGGQRQDLATVEREDQRSMAVVGAPCTAVVQALVVDVDAAAAVHVVVVDMRAVAVADV